MVEPKKKNEFYFLILLFLPPPPSPLLLIVLLPLRNGKTWPESKSCNSFERGHFLIIPKAMQANSNYGLSSYFNLTVSMKNVLKLIMFEQN